MREGELLYFTRRELEWMLELSGGPEYSVYSTGQEKTKIREEDMACTLASLYQRGFLREDGGRLVPGEKGGFFREMRSAPLAVMLTARYSRNSASVCYGGNGHVWVVEQIATTLTEECRLWRVDVPGLELWFLSAGMLPPPRLSREDAREWNGALEEPVSGETVLRLERHRNGGGPTGEYEVIEGCGTHVILIRADGLERMELYTKEALREMLAECFHAETETDTDTEAASDSVTKAEDAAMQKGTP